MNDRDFWTAIYLESIKLGYDFELAEMVANTGVEARNALGAKADRAALAAHWNG